MRATRRTVSLLLFVFAVFAAISPAAASLPKLSEPLPRHSPHQVDVDRLEAVLLDYEEPLAAPRDELPAPSRFSLWWPPAALPSKLLSHSLADTNELVRLAEIAPSETPSLSETRVGAFTLFNPESQPASNRLSRGDASTFGLGLVGGHVGHAATSLYAFVGHQPHMATDPLGLERFYQSAAEKAEIRRRLEAERAAAERQRQHEEAVLARRRAKYEELQRRCGVTPCIGPAQTYEEWLETQEENAVIAKRNREARMILFATVEAPNTISAVMSGRAPRGTAQGVNPQPQMARGAPLEPAGPYVGSPFAGPPPPATVVGPEIAPASSASTGVQPYTDAPGGLRRVAVQAHAAQSGRGVEQSAVAVVRVKLPNGQVTLYASGSRGYLRPAQRAVLEQFGVPRENILSGAQYYKGYSREENHAERVIMRNLPEGAVIEEWGISWTTPQKPVPCVGCRDQVVASGGAIQPQ